MARAQTSTLSRGTKKWREFERLVASIEKRLAPETAVIRSPDRIKDIDTGHPREVDASIRIPAGSADILITIECRQRGAKDDVTWIEQLATKRMKVGAAKTIAVSAKGFSRQAIESAARYGIELRTLQPVSDGQISGWLGLGEVVHFYRSVTEITCEVLTVAGEVIDVDAMEPRFLEPNVHGLFPAATFLNFIEMQNPEAFSISLDGVPVPHTFELRGDDPKLIPVPLGERRKPGPLKVSTAEGESEVEKILLNLKLTHVAHRVQSSEGQHFTYGPPGEPQHTLSEYRTEMFDQPVTITHHSGNDGKAIAPTLRFPSGLELPGSIVNPRLYEVEDIDVERLTMRPIAIKLKTGELVEGVFIFPTKEIVSDDDERERIAAEAFIFITRANLEWLRENVISRPGTRMDRNILHVIPKQFVEYVDIGAALGA